MSELKGLPRLLLNINTMLLSTTAGAKIAYQAATIVEKRAKQSLAGKLTPAHPKHHITGNLMRSIKAGIPTPIGPAAFSVPIGTDVVYAMGVEVRDQTGGYLRPALKESKKDVMAFVKKKVTGEVL